MVAARATAWSGYTAKDYVQAGLIAMWDGIENAGWGVHDPNATVWKDLVGNGDLPISQFGSFGDRFLTGDENRTGNIFTVSPVYDFSSTDKITIDCLFSIVKQNNSNNYFSVFGVTGSQLEYYAGGNFVFSCSLASRNLHYITPVKLSLGVHRVTYVRTENVELGYEIYLDGTRVIHNRSGFQGTASFDFAKTELIMLSPQNTSSGICHLYRASLYGGALTTDKIAANYAVDKARFGL